jgi:hypothetical protein
VVRGPSFALCLTALSEEGGRNARYTRKSQSTSPLLKFQRAVLFSLAFDLESGGADLLSVFEKAFEGFENAVDVFLRQVCAVRNAEFNLIDVYGCSPCR